MENNVLQKVRDLVKSDDNILVVRKLLIGGIVDPNIQNSQKENLLHVAAQSPEDNEGIVKALIYAGVDVNRGNCFSYKPLHIAVIYRKRRVVNALLHSRIHVNSKDKWGKTALHYAINNKLPRTVRFRDVPIHVHAPDLWIIRKLLDHKHINVNQADFSLETPLMQAVRDKKLEIVKLLLNYDAQRLDFSNKYGQTPLHIALYHKDPCPYIIVMLLLKRVTVLKMNSDDRTPLDIIIRTKSLDSACLCLKIIAFNYNIRGLLINKLLKSPILLQFLERYYDEINRMKLDTIAHEVTVFDFFAKCAPKAGIHNPILQIYKPVVERLVAGHYPEYFCYILHRISKSNLCLVLRALIGELYGKSCGVENCKKDFTGFLEVFRIGFLNDYLSNFDIFCLIIAVSRAKIDESLLNICHRGCYLTDSWKEYPDEHFH